MRILQVVPSLALRHGGVSGFVRELSRGLARLGETVEVWTTLRGYDPKIDAPYDERLKADGVHLRYFPVHSFPLLGERYAYSPSLRVALRSDLNPFDLVHLHALWLYPSVAASRACRRLQIPYLISPHGAIDPYCLRRHRIFKWLYGILVERRTLQGAAAVHFTSPMEQAKAWTFGLKRPGIVAPCSISFEEIPSVPEGTFRHRYPEVGNRRILLFLGRLHPKKRPDIVADSFVFLAHRLPDTHLVFVGPDEGAVSQIRNSLRRAGLLGRVTFTGPLMGESKWAALRDAHLFLLPSEDENFGMAALEAMASGLPILLSAQVGLSEMVGREQAGLVVDQNPSAWASAIEQLLNDPLTHRAMGEAGRQLAATQFSTCQVTKAMRNLYAKILKETPDPE